MSSESDWYEVEIVNDGQDQLSVHARGDSPDKEPVVLDPGASRVMHVRGNLRLKIAAGQSRTLTS